MAGAGRNRDEGEEPFDSQNGDALELGENSERLALEEDERLPWLDADDDDDTGEAGGGRIMGLAILGLIALATIIGGIWWSSNRDTDPALVADGSTIPAPSETYKEAPKDPGGKTFDGTGDTAFAVSEGQDRSAKLGEAPPQPGASGAAAKPGFGLGNAPSDLSAPPPGKGPVAAASPSPAANTATTPSGGPVVQVGAYASRASAEAAWGRLSQRYSVLSGQRYRIVEGQADIGTVFRLQAIPGDAAAAQSLCTRLKASGLACQVK